MKQHQGYSLVELAIVLVVLGIMTVVAAKLLPKLIHSPDVVRGSRVLIEVDQALSGFAYTHTRLPCPDTSVPADGLEDCAGAAAVGWVPYHTLGLAARPRNPSGLDLRYGVYRKANAGSPENDTDLAIRLDRFKPLLPSGSPPLALPTTLGNINGLDFCHALRSAARATASSSYVHVGTTTNVAYVLADPGPGDAAGDASVFDGSNVTGLKFERPDLAGAANYNDRVLVMDFDHLWARLGCAAGFSAASHAQANNALAAAIFKQALKDYRFQVVLSVELTTALVSMGAAAIAGGIAAGAKVATKLAIMAAQIATPPAFTAQGTASVPGTVIAIILVAAAQVKAAIVVTLAASVLIFMGVILDDLDNGYGGNDSLLTQSSTLATEMRAQAEKADQVGIYGQ